MDSVEKKMLDAVERLASVFGEIEDIIDQNDLDAEPILCDDYPFGMSFDEQYYEVLQWRDTMREKVNS